MQAEWDGDLLLWLRENEQLKFTPPHLTENGTLHECLIKADQYPTPAATIQIINSIMLQNTDQVVKTTRLHVPKTFLRGSHELHFSVRDSLLQRQQSHQSKLQKKT